MPLQHIPGLVLLSALSCYLASGLRVVKESGDPQVDSLAESEQSQWPFPPSPSFFPPPPPTTCTNLAGQYTSSFNNQRLTFTQSGCQGSASGDQSFSYTVSGTTVTLTSGALVGAAGFILGTSPNIIAWTDGTMYTQVSVVSTTVTTTRQSFCPNLAGQYTVSFSTQTQIFTQSGCQGNVIGDVSFSYTVSGSTITATSGAVIGSTGSISAGPPYIIQWQSGAVYTQTGGQNPAPAPPTFGPPTWPTMPPPTTTMQSSCPNLAGQYTAPIFMQPQIFTQSGCQGNVMGDFNFSYTVAGSTITATSGQFSGNTGSISSGPPYSITWQGNGIVYTQGGGSNPAPPTFGPPTWPTMAPPAPPPPTTTTKSGKGV